MVNVGVQCNFSTVKKMTKKKISDVTKNFLKSKGHSDSMVKKLFNPSGKKRLHYDKKEICDAMVLRSISRKGFEFVRKNMCVPVPSKRFLDRWFKDFKTVPGMQHDMFSLVKSKFSESDHHDRQAVLVFDEMDLKEEYVFDGTTKKVFKPHKKAQVVLLRGLIRPWKQLVYFNYDKNMTKKLLDEIITESEKADVNVRGVVFDMGNHTFIKEVKLISQNKTFFLNPVHPTRRVHMFPDVPHMESLNIYVKWLVDGGGSSLLSNISSIHIGVG